MFHSFFVVCTGLIAVFVKIQSVVKCCSKNFGVANSGQVSSVNHSVHVEKIDVVDLSFDNERFVTGSQVLRLLR